MADVIHLLDESAHTVFKIRDMLDLIGTHMGDDARSWLEQSMTEKDDLSENVTDLENEVRGLREHYRSVMRELRDESEKIAGLIREKNIDRKSLSTAAGRIGTITWRELNV